MGGIKTGGEYYIMRNLDEIIVSESTLSLLLGGLNIRFKFPKDSKNKRKEKVSLQYILDYEDKGVYGEKLDNQVAIIRSFDDRFDGKHPVTLAVENIKEKGIRKSILNNIYNDKGCIRVGKLVGKYAIFNDLLSDNQKKEIEKRLKLAQDLINERKENLKNWCK